MVSGVNPRDLKPLADDAKKTVGALIDEFGFDAVDVGPLAEGWRYQPDTPAYNVRQDADELRAALAQATRRTEAG